MKDNYYFDNAATTWPKPEPVYQFMDSFFRSHGVNPGRSGHTLAVEAEAMIFQTRRLLAQFFNFGGDPNRVVFTQNATDSLNMALQGILSDGDHVITSQLEHNAVLRTCSHLQRDRGIAVTHIQPDDKGCISCDSVAEAITEQTRVVVLNHASNVTGAIQDINAIGALARSHGLTFILDTAQTAGVVPIDMSAGIDVLTFTGHKGLFGPMGVGGLIVGESVELKPIRYGGTGVDSASVYQPDEYPHRLEAGTISIPGIAGLNAAQKWFAKLVPDALPAGENNHYNACKAAIESIHATEMEHSARIWNHLQSMNSVTTLGNLDDGPHVATLSFTVDGMTAQQVAEMMDADHHICVRAGLHCAPQAHRAYQTDAGGGAVRLSPGYFTEAEDVDHLLAALDDLCS
jgi:cysteine desulfurase family protein